MVIRAVGVTFTAECFAVRLSDGRSLTVPLYSFPRLARATPAQRQNVRISATGLHWPDLDEDISVTGLMRRVPDMTSRSDS